MHTAIKGRCFPDEFSEFIGAGNFSVQDSLASFFQVLWTLERMHDPCQRIFQKTSFPRLIVVYGVDNVYALSEATAV